MVQPLVRLYHSFHPPNPAFFLSAVVVARFLCCVVVCLFGHRLRQPSSAQSTLQRQRRMCCFLQPGGRSWRRLRLIRQTIVRRSSAGHPDSDPYTTSAEPVGGTLRLPGTRHCHDCCAFDACRRLPAGGATSSSGYPIFDAGSGDSAFRFPVAHDGTLDIWSTGHTRTCWRSPPSMPSACAQRVVHLHSVL